MAAAFDEEFDPAAPPWSTGSGEPSYLERAQLWLRTDALKGVVAAFSSDPGAALVLELFTAGDTLQLAQAMKLWSAATLDTRRGHERQMAPRVHFSAHQRQALVRAAEPLGLWASRRPTARKARAVVLGGTITANQLRTSLAASLVDAGIVSEVVVVGGARLLQPWETELFTAASAPGTTHASEIQHLSWVAQQTFGAAEPHPENYDQRRHQPGARVPLTVLEAQPSRSGHRPNTLDCYRAVERLRPYRTTILITSAIYQPYTFFLLAPYLPKTEATEIIGTRSRLARDESLTAQLIGQEIHAAIQAAAALLDDQPGNSRPQ